MKHGNQISFISILKKSIKKLEISRTPDYLITYYNKIYHKMTSSILKISPKSISEIIKTPEKGGSQLSRPSDDHCILKNLFIV